MTTTSPLSFLPVEDSHPGVRPPPFRTPEELRRQLSEYSVQCISSDPTTLKADLRNLLAVSEAAVMFLTADLQVRWATPAAGSHLSGSDGSKSLPPFLQDACRSVLENHESVSLERRRSPDQTLRFRLGPYVTPTGEVDGVVVSMTDVTRQRRLERELAQISEAERRRIGEDRGVVWNG